MNLSRAGSTPQPDRQARRVLATFPARASPEAWVRVRRYSASELPLAAVIVLRRAGTGRLGSSASGGDDGRRQSRTRSRSARSTGAQRRRFEAVGDLVERVPVFCLLGGSQGPTVRARRNAAGRRYGRTC